LLGCDILPQFSTART